MPRKKRNHSAECFGIKKINVHSYTSRDSSSCVLLWLESIQEYNTSTHNLNIRRTYITKTRHIDLMVDFGYTFDKKCIVQQKLFLLNLLVNYKVIKSDNYRFIVFSRSCNTPVFNGKVTNSH